MKSNNKEAIIMKSNNGVVMLDVREFRRNDSIYTEKCWLYRGVVDGQFMWMFKGGCIPMPIKSGTWFHGFEPKVMERWMRCNNWVLATRISLASV